MTVFRLIEEDRSDDATDVGVALPPERERLREIERTV